MVVKKAGKLVGIDLKPHDLRRFAATYASRSGTPIEIVRYFHAIQTCRPLKGTLEKSAMWKPCSGLITCMLNAVGIGLEVPLALARFLQRFQFTISQQYVLVYLKKSAKEYSLIG